MANLTKKMMDEYWALFRIMCSGDKEWPGYKAPDDEEASLPLLIAEIYRLVPYIGEEYIEFHAKNMPDAKIHKVEIVGLVTAMRTVDKYTTYTVEDGTSAITVLCITKKLHRIVEDLSDEEPTGSNTLPPKVPKLKPPYGLAPEAPYSYDQHINHLLSRVKNQQILVSQLDVYDYAHIIGFCCMNFRKFKDINELTKDDIETGRLFIYATHLRRISEMQHNRMLKNLITDLAKERYVKPKE